MDFDIWGKVILFGINKLWIFNVKKFGDFNSNYFWYDWGYGIGINNVFSGRDDVVGNK